MTLGLAPQAQDENPYNSKYNYVSRRLRHLDLGQLLTIAEKRLDERHDESLEQLVASFRGGSLGTTKNLIFAAMGPKPEIVLRDATTNHVEITEGADRCLVYRRPLGRDGLSWQALTDSFVYEELRQAEGMAPQVLWKRLQASLDSEPEKLLHHVYAGRYTDPSTPALLPQVYLHFDPFSRPVDERPGIVWRQRMDFLLLLPGRRRVVLEVDGKHHYSTSGRPDPGAYARMVREDRRLRLAGYEVYRFGGAEFVDAGNARAMLDTFFDQLLSPYPQPHL